MPDTGFLLGFRFTSESWKLEGGSLFKKCHFNLQCKIPDPNIFLESAVSEENSTIIKKNTLQNLPKLRCMQKY